MSRLTRSIAHRIVTDTLAEGGATVSPLDPFAPAPTTGYVVALAGAERVIPLASLTVDAVTTYVIDNAAEIAHTPGVFVGAWVNEGQVYLDLSTVIEDKATALETGATNAQLAVFHLDTLTEVTL